MWRTQGRQASFESSHLSAGLDIWRPSSGFTNVQAFGRNIQGASLLQIHLPVEEYAPQDVECYTRGRDLVVTYAPRPDFPFRMQIYWRAVDSSDRATGIELVAAIQTNLLDSWPVVAVSSRVPITALGALSSSNPASYQSIGFDGSEWRVVACDAYRGCFVGRLGDGQVSYAEMVHPLDFHASQVRRESWGTPADATTVLKHDLFTHHLEKGVILKARLRTLFFSGGADNDIREAYEAFENSEPPLTT